MNPLYDYYSTPSQAEKSKSNSVEGVIAIVNVGASPTAISPKPTEISPWNVITNPSGNSILICCCPPVSAKSRNFLNSAAS